MVKLTFYLFAFFAFAFALLAIFAADVVTEVSKTESEVLQLYGIATLILINIGGFAGSWIGKYIQRRWDLQDLAAKEAKIEKERIASEERARNERQTIADKIKAELELHYLKQSNERKENSKAIIQQVCETGTVVKQVDEKVVTLDVEAQHHVEILEVLKENTEVSKDAFREANHVKQTIEKIVDAGLLNQEQEKIRDESELSDDVKT